MRDPDGIVNYAATLPFSRPPSSPIPIAMRIPRRQLIEALQHRKSRRQTSPDEFERDVAATLRGLVLRPYIAATGFDVVRWWQAWAIACCFRRHAGQARISATACMGRSSSALNSRQDSLIVKAISVVPALSTHRCAAVVTTRKACASVARVTQRCQEVQRRT